MTTTPKRQMNSSVSSSASSRRNEVLIGNLPDDFLRIDDGNNYGSVSESAQIANDEQAALALQQQYFGTELHNVPNNIRGRLDITVTEARLTKNYGVTRMDPYLRLRVGHHIYETKTCYNGAKNPKWNKVFHCFLPNGVDSFHVEIFDECAFSTDERIAWGLYTIPKKVFDGETVEDFVLLNGKQGDGREGSLGLVISFTPLPATSAMFTAPVAFVNPATLVMPPTSGVVCGSPIYVHPAPQSNHVPNAGGTNPPEQSQQPPTQTQQQQQQQQPQQQLQEISIQIAEDDVKQLLEMFPSVESEVIRTILETNRGNKERAVTALLQLTTEA